MNLRTTMRRHRDLRAGLRSERALRRALAEAPTVESAHEIAAAATRR